MRSTFGMAALAALIALPMLAASNDADASCRGRKNTGTAIGAIGGALLGNSISKGGGGAVVGGLGGAVVGHEIARSGCNSSHADYRHTRTNRYAYENRPAQRIYYDRYGNPVSTATYDERR